MPIPVDSVTRERAYYRDRIGALATLAGRLYGTLAIITSADSLEEAKEIADEEMTVSAPCGSHELFACGDCKLAKLFTEDTPNAE